MSRVRTHFWTQVARGYGGVASPRKYGLNGTMPALTNSSVGSSSSSDARRHRRVAALGEEAQEAARGSRRSPSGCGPLGGRSGERCWAWAREPAVPTRRASRPARRLAVEQRCPRPRRPRARCGTPSRPPCSRWSRRGSRCRRARARAPRSTACSPRRAATYPAAAPTPTQIMRRTVQLLLLGYGVLLDLRPYLRGCRRVGRVLAAERHAEPVEDVGVPRLGAVAGRARSSGGRRAGRARTAALPPRPGGRAGSGSRCRGPGRPRARSGRRAGAAGTGPMRPRRTSASAAPIAVMTAFDFGASAMRDGRLRQGEAPLRQSDQLHGLGCGHGGLQGAGVGQPDVLAGEDHQSARDEAGVLPRLQHPGQVVQRGVDVATRGST